MRSEIIERAYEDILDQMGIAIGDLDDPEIFTEFLSYFWVMTAEDDVLSGECEDFYERSEEKYLDDAYENEFENEPKEEDVIESEDFGERIDLSECDDPDEKYDRFTAEFDPDDGDYPEDIGEDKYDY